MSEYQYYEFQAVDRPLGEAASEALRTLSTRLRITVTSFGIGNIRRRHLKRITCGVGPGHGEEISQ